MSGSPIALDSKALYVTHFNNLVQEYSATDASLRGAVSFFPDRTCAAVALGADRYYIAGLSSWYAILKQ